MSNIEILYGFVLEESIKLSVSFFIIVFCKLIVKLNPFSKKKKSKEVLVEEKNVINVKNIKNVKHITYKKILNNEKDLLKRIASLEKIILDQKKEEKKEALAIKEAVIHAKGSKSVVARLPKRFDPWQL